MLIKKAIAQIVEGRDLTERQAATIMTEIMDGKATTAQIASFLTALRMKGETVPELTGCARVMREKALTIEIDPVGLIDTCGTGGDQANTFNISTTAAFVVKIYPPDRYRVSLRSPVPSGHEICRWTPAGDGHQDHL